MCIDRDTGKMFKKFDVYYVDLGTNFDDARGDIIKERPCIIMSDNNSSYARYLVVPIRTEHSMDVTTAEKAEKIVEECKRKGRFNVPIKMEENLYRFAEITQMRSVAIQRIQNYHTTIMNPAVRKRLEEEVENYLFSNAKIQITPYNRKTDICTMVKKFDIWTCMTGKEIQSKYVVLRADTMNDAPYLTVAPIYNESPRGVYSDEVDEYIKGKRKEGIVCVPFRYSSTSNEYSFINMSKLQSITSSQLKKFECSIINTSIRKDINNKIIELLFNEDEAITCDLQITDSLIPIVDTVTQDESIEPKIQIKPKKEIHKKKFPDNWDEVYEEYINSNLTGKEASELLDISFYKFNDLLKVYRKELKQQGKEIKMKPKCTKIKTIKDSVRVQDVKVEDLENTPTETFVIVAKESNVEKTEKSKIEIPSGFSVRYKQFQSGKITRKEFAESYNITFDELTDLIKQYEKVRDPL